MSEEATTPDLIERLQRFVNAINARDFDAAVSIYAHDAMFYPRSSVPGVLEGRGEIRGLFEEWFAPYEEFVFEADELREFAPGVAFVVFSQRGRLPGTRGWVQDRFATVTTLTDGLIEKQTNYLDPDQARAAAERLAQERG